LKIGFLINPIAGMGGRVGLKGTDNLVDEAIKRGAKPIAPKRAKAFLEKLKELMNYGDIKLDIISCKLNMGEDVIKEIGLKAKYIDIPKSRKTSREDTINAVKIFVKYNVSVIVFVGGDGTARDVYQGLREAGRTNIPILGVPSGVKIYSGIFGITPEDSAYTLVEYLKGGASVMDLEILDIDEKAFREDRIDIKLYAYAKGIYIPFHIQYSKQLSPDTVDEAENQRAIAEYLLELMDKKGIYIIGPGTTTKKFADLLGIKKTLLGVDIYYKGIKVYNDVCEKDILDIIDDEKNVWIIVTPIGRQGILFGRGNQQISPKVIKKVGRENIIVIATYRKLRDIPDGVLRVDTQDPDVDEYLRGYIRVIIDYRTWRMVQVK